MVLRKKERVLTPAEFKAKQKRDYAPFWFNTEVLFGANLYPVAESFENNVNVLFLLDVADYTTERVLTLLDYWDDKYGKLNWNGILVFQQRYAFLNQAKFFERYKQQKVFLDTFGELFQRFGSENEPVAVILKNNELITSMPLSKNFSQTAMQLELELQKSLRMGDPGLPLAAPGLLPEKSSKGQQSVGPDGVSTFGEWNGTNTLLVTEKNGSIISVPFKGKNLRLIAMAHPNSRDNIKIGITLNEKHISNAAQTSLIHEDNNGDTFFEINKTTGIYDLVQSDTELTGVIKLTFLNAYDNGAVFYAFKIS